MRARIAAHARWSRERDRQAATAKGRAAWLCRFEQEVDLVGQLDPKPRTKQADSARKSYLTQLAFRSAKARRRRNTSGDGPIHVGEGLAEVVEAIPVPPKVDGDEADVMRLRHLIHRQQDRDNLADEKLHWARIDVSDARAALARGDIDTATVTLDRLAEWL